MTYDAIIVLSGGITPKGRLPYYVKARLDEAYHIYRRGGTQRIIVSGKWNYLYDGEPKYTEAEAMRKYLLSIGVEKHDIYLEDHSTNIVAKAYYIKHYLSMHEWKHALVIGSEFHRGKVEYVFNKIISRRGKVHYHFIPEYINPNMLWHIYSYEVKRLNYIKSHLEPIGKLTNEKIRYIIQCVGNPILEQPNKHVRFLISEGVIGRPWKGPPHYSLTRIDNKKKEILNKYGLYVDKSKPELKADFWLKRFLNFLVYDEKKNEYVIKMLLKPKDKSIFKNEILITNYLTQNGFSFFPKVIDINITDVPYWYLYKVIPGEISGFRSRRFSFNKEFYTESYMNSIINNLLMLQKINVTSNIHIEKIDSSFYMTRLYKRQKKLLSIHYEPIPNEFKKLASVLKRNKSIIDQAETYFAHGDLNPANIILSTKLKKTNFIDFEHAHYHTIAYDFTFLYVFCWDNPGFQKKLLNTYVSKLSKEKGNEFKNIFHYEYAYHLTMLYKIIIEWRLRAKKERFLAARKHVLKEMQVASKAF